MILLTFDNHVTVDPSNILPIDVSTYPLSHRTPRPLRIQPVS